MPSCDTVGFFWRAIRFSLPSSPIGVGPFSLKNVELLRESFQQARSKLSFDIDAIVVLPDHFHLLMTPRVPKGYPRVIGSIKHYFSRFLDPTYLADYQEPARDKKRHKSVWQRRYYEHTIRDEEDYQKHLDYIHWNPVKHGIVRRPGEWRYSSFDKYVDRGYYPEDWCDFSNELDLE